MLGYSPFYNSSIKNMVAVFGTLFSDMAIIRHSSTTTDQTVNVPLTYTSKDKAYIRKTVDPNTDHNMGRVFPAMSFFLPSITYDSSRKLSKTNRFNVSNTAGNTATSMFSPAPYNLNFELYIGTNNIEDGLQILEQILPFFDPEFTVTTKDFPNINLFKDVPIVLNSVDHTDNTMDSEYTDSRLMEWTLRFTAKAYIYGPTSIAKLIKDVKNFVFFDPLMPVDKQAVKIESIVVPLSANNLIPPTVLVTTIT